MRMCMVRAKAHAGRCRGVCPRLSEQSRYGLSYNGGRNGSDTTKASKKTINLGLMYGMGVGKMSDQLDITLDEAKRARPSVSHTGAFVKMLMTGVQNRLNDKSSSGSIRSLLGRKCRFDLWEPDTFEMNKALPYREAVQEYGDTTRLKRAYTYKALNRLIQASAADMTKKAMVDIYKTGRIPLIQIHDEIAMSVKDKKDAETVSQMMKLL